MVGAAGQGKKFVPKHFPGLHGMTISDCGICIQNEASIFVIFLVKIQV